MIRINLLSEGRRPVAAKEPRVRGGSVDQASLALVVMFGIALLGALGYNFLLGRAVGQKKAEIAEAQREVDELAPIIKEVEEFKAKRAELERKVDVISDLKRRQHGPVLIMDEISRALPELLWLQKMDVKSSKIILTGQAFNTNAVANFIENLDLVESFNEPVLKDTRYDRDVYVYVIEFNYSFALPPAEDGDELPDEAALNS
jgi:type IV pilus assembly protein PilN